MKSRMSTLLVLSVFLLFLPFATAQNQLGDAGEVTVSIFHWPKHKFVKQPPLEIVELKVANQRVLPGKPFPRPEGWIKTLSVTVRNISQKNVKYLSLRIEFAPDSKGNQILSDRFLSSGQMFHFSPRISRYGDDVTLAPSQTIDVVAGNRVAWGLGGEIASKGLSRKVADSATIRVELVIFDDNTGWFIGSAAVRDRDNPGLWVRDKSQDPKS